MQPAEILPRANVAKLRWPIRWGLVFAEPAEERAFADRYVGDAVGQSQIFLLISGLFFYIFFLWDRVIDPVGGETAHALRGFFASPLMFACAALLLTRFGKRWTEAIILFAYCAGQTTLVVIYAILARGYDYAAVGLIILYMGMATAMPLRSGYLVFGALFAIVSTFAGHVVAHNAQPGWLYINMLAIVTAVGFATAASFLRERAARRQFVTDRALDGARERVDDLLHSILPRDIAQRIQAGEGNIADSLGEVSIVFIDMVGFTKHARNAEPAELTGVLNKIFSAFDGEAARFGIDKIKTIGDAYMAIGGLERGEASHDHAINAAAFALSAQEIVKRMAPSLPWPIEIRVGIHVGPVVAGVIGVQRPAFDCWGEAVNLAARLERKAPPGEILVSESAYWRLRRSFRVDPFETLDLKGIGQTNAYLLRDRVAGHTSLIFDAQIPVAASAPVPLLEVAPATRAPLRLSGFADSNTPGLSLLKRALAWIGLYFVSNEDEVLFAEGFARKSIGIVQIFLAAAGISFLSYYTWDQIVDPVNAWTATQIRIFVVLPLMLACSASLFVPRFRRHLEWVVLTAYSLIQLGQIWIYNILAHGFDYAVMGLVLITLAMATCFPMRAKFVALGALIGLAITVVGHFAANNSRPGWLLINILAMGSAVVFGILAAAFRERAARVQFMTDRALAASRARADELLGSILPADTVRRIQSGETAIADALESVSIVFADLAGFTALSRQLSPPDLIRLLNTLFSRFDALASEHGLERIKTIGDAYIAVGGMGGAVDPDHSGNAARFALAIRDAARTLMQETDYPINIRIGVHSGPVIAGVIGIKRPSFDCWGDTVVFASGLESQALPGTILVSDALAERLGGRFSVAPVDDVHIGSAAPTRAWELTGASVQ
jgi:adenylate cyclase